MWVAKQARGQKLAVLPDLRRSVETGACVIEVCVARGIEPRVVECPDLVEPSGRLVLRVLADKFAESIGGHSYPLPASLTW